MDFLHKINKRHFGKDFSYTAIFLLLVQAILCLSMYFFSDHEPSKAILTKLLGFNFISFILLSCVGIINSLYLTNKHYNSLITDNTFVKNHETFKYKDSFLFLLWQYYIYHRPKIKVLLDDYTIVNVCFAVTAGMALYFGYNLLLVKLGIFIIICNFISVVYAYTRIKSLINYIYKDEIKTDKLIGFLEHSLYSKKNFWDA